MFSLDITDRVMFVYFFITLSLYGLGFVRLLYRWRMDAYSKCFFCSCCSTRANSLPISGSNWSTPSCPRVSKGKCPPSLLNMLFLNKWDSEINGISRLNTNAKSGACGGSSKLLRLFTFWKYRPTSKCSVANKLGEDALATFAKLASDEPDNSSSGKLFSCISGGQRLYIRVPFQDQTGSNLSWKWISRVL